MHTCMYCMAASMAASAAHTTTSMQHTCNTHGRIHGSNGGYHKCDIRYSTVHLDLTCPDTRLCAHTYVPRVHGGSLTVVVVVSIEGELCGIRHLKSLMSRSPHVHGSADHT